MITRASVDERTRAPRRARGHADAHHMLAALTLAAALASSNGLLVTDSGLTAAARDVTVDDALRAGARHPAKAKKALALAVASGTPAQTYRALKLLAKHDPAVRARLEAALPAVPFTEATGGQARALNGAFERALLDTALPITSDPSRRKGRLHVGWTMRRADGAGAWSIEASAKLGGKDGHLVAAKTTTLVTGATAEAAARAGMATAANDLAKALLAALAQEAAGAVAVAPTRRTLEKVAALKERATEDRKSAAVLAAFPAGIDVAVKGRGDTRAWGARVEEMLAAVSEGALPLEDAPADHVLKVSVTVEELGGDVLAAKSLRRYKIKATARFVFDDGTAEGQTLAQVAKVAQVMGSSADEAAAAGAEKIARAVYDAMVDEVSALRYRRPRA